MNTDQQLEKIIEGVSASQIENKNMETRSEEVANKPEGSLLLAWQVKNKHCLVIGAGEVALSRVHHLIRANARITVITGAAKTHPEIQKLHEEGKIYSLLERNYKTEDLTLYEKISNLIIDVGSITPAMYPQLDNMVKNEEFAIVCCCIDDYELSTQIYYQCKYLRIPVNIADKPPLCDYYFGSMFNQENLQIMVSTNGKSPRLSKLIKDNIAKEFKDIDLNKAVENLGLIRSRLRSKMAADLLDDNDLTNIEVRMTWIKTLTDFFSLKQWSEITLIPPSSKPPFDNRFQYIDRIIKYFPDYPPNDFEEFKRVICNE